MVICFHYIPVQTSLAWTCVCSLALVNWGKWHGVAPLQGFIQSIFPSFKTTSVAGPLWPGWQRRASKLLKGFWSASPSASTRISAFWQRCIGACSVKEKMGRWSLQIGSHAITPTMATPQVGNASTLRSIHYPPIPDSLAARSFRYHCIKGGK